LKAYQIKIEMIDSNPLIWRRVKMPADATFNRLHEIIKMVTNFQDYHLFEFNLEKDNILVTNDEEIYEEHKYFMKNRKELEEKILDVPPEFVKFAENQLQRLKTIIRKPTGLKIDKYLETYGELHYTYDYGDHWQMLITLEDVIQDHYYGYPVLVDGEGTAPPEDVGGFMGYAEFLDIFNDPSHPDYEEIIAWAKERNYREYDPEFLNGILKLIKYKKTEWDKINK